MKYLLIISKVILSLKKIFGLIDKRSGGLMNCDFWHVNILQFSFWKSIVYVTDIEDRQLRKRNHGKCLQIP